MKSEDIIFINNIAYIKNMTKYCTCEGCAFSLPSCIRLGITCGRDYNYKMLKNIRKFKINQILND